MQPAYLIDDDECPYDRGHKVFCLNCGENWNFHDGWACDLDSEETCKSELKESERYLTHDMVTTIDIRTIRPVGEPIVQSKTKSKECPCGIIRATCDYHA